MQPNERIEVLKANLKKKGLGVALLIYSRDIFYYTGTAQPSFLAVSGDDYTLFVKSGFEFARREVFIDPAKMIEERRPEKIYRHFFAQLPEGVLGTELDIMTVKQARMLKKSFKGFELTDISKLILEQRGLKDETELVKIRRACEAVHAGHGAVLANLREGISELELAACVENAHRLAGHEGDFFFRMPDFFMSRGPISSGPNLERFSGVVYSVTGVGLSAAMPVGPSRRTIQWGDLVVIDIPCMIEGYHCDQTRTYCLGPAPGAVRSLYADLKKIADHTIALIRPGAKCSDIYHAAVARAEELGIQDAFLSFGNGKKSFLIGHGVGLEVNEPPIISSHNDASIVAGAVMAVEMHALAKGMGVIKLEDTIHVGSHGNEILTKSPRRLFEVKP
jgi:Xaa-Pro aminopeptidase